MFMDFTNPEYKGEIEMVVEPKPISTAPKKLMYKAQFMMKNWDDADV